MKMVGRGINRNSLSPIDPEQLLQSLQLTTGKAAEFCDISRRQLCYWTDKGIVETIEGDGEDFGEEGARRVYDFPALHRVLLIKQLLEQGRGLKRATREVETYLQQMEDDELQPDADRRTREERLQHHTERLDHLAEQVKSAVQRGRVSPADLRELIRDIHYFIELMAYEESATIHLQEDVGAANQFHALIDQLALKIDETVSEPAYPTRRMAR